MKLRVCVDLNKGMLFNNRRLSRDSALSEHIKNLVKENNIWINSFSIDLFENEKYFLFDEKNINEIGKNDFCFIENLSLKSLEQNIEEIILYNWNRKYPADLYFDINLKNWKIKYETELKGSSHCKLTQTIYIKGENK